MMWITYAIINTEDDELELSLDTPVSEISKLIANLVDQYEPTSLVITMAWRSRDREITSA